MYTHFDLPPTDSVSNLDATRNLNKYIKIQKIDIALRIVQITAYSIVIAINYHYSNFEITQNNSIDFLLFINLFMLACEACFRYLSIRYVYLNNFKVFLRLEILLQILMIPFTTGLSITLFGG